MAALKMGEGDSDGCVGEQEMHTGRVLPLNSKRQTANHLRLISNVLDLPTFGSADQMHHLIKGKLCTDQQCPSGH